MNDQTSLITILSSDHGRLRREQRDIRKRDLQKALKYGTREKAWGGRWKIEYDGIIFITDQYQCGEVTAYPSPLSLAPLDYKERDHHVKAKLVIERKSDLCTSHTVLVVDNSGSMNTHDIILHRDRQVAAYTLMALEYIAEQLFNESANNRDVVSLIEFSNTARVIFKREPISWVLFNKLLSRRDIKGDFRGRERARLNDALFCDSNYLPALDQAEKLLELDNHDDCALSLFFISDGEPTDAGHQGLTPIAALRKMKERTAAIATRFCDQINMSLVGFGNSLLDFSSLKSMAEAANEATGMPVAEFVYCDKVANSIGAAVSSLAASTTLTRTALMNGGRLTKKNTRTDVVSENESFGGISNEWKFFKIVNHYVYDPSTNDWIHYTGLPPGALREENVQEAKRMLSHNQLPPFLALNKAYCGSGVERVAFRCHLSNQEMPAYFRLGAMVAKETLRVDRIEELVTFHKTFCETQSLAAHLADEFNKRLRAIPNYSTLSTPRVTFLKCSVLILHDPSWPRGKRGVLVEKQLDTSRFEWRKWNNNAGGVEGKASHRPMDVDLELARLDEALNVPAADIFAIQEGSDEESDDDFSDDEYADHFAVCHEIEDDDDDELSPSDYLQAFSHFTYLFTNKKVLVCDLQGIYNTDMVPPVFELSDPAIHYRSRTKGKEMVFGRTDKGEKGVQLFFNSHHCTRICKFMHLSKKNKNWNKTWHRNFAEDMANNFSLS